MGDKNDDKIEEIVDKRPIDSYPSSLEKTALLISYKSSDLSYDPIESAVPFGSASYRMQKYPGDLDLIEWVIGDTKISTIQDFVDTMSKKIDKIMKMKDHWIVDIKAGRDPRYDLPKIALKSVQPMSDEFITRLIEIAAIGGTSDKFRGFISNLLEGDGNITIRQIVMLETFIHDHETIRWTPKEFMAGKKVHRDKKIKLIDAIGGPDSHVKIDMITFINGLFSEVTNFFYLGYINEFGDIIPINTSNDFSDPNTTARIYGEQMRGDIFKLAHPIKGSPKYFKIAKRMWAYSRFYFLRNDKSFAQYIDKLTPLVAGEYSALYQIASSLEAFLLVNRIYGVEAHFQAFFDRIKYNLASFIYMPQKDLENYILLIDTGKIDKIELAADSIRKVVNEGAYEYLSGVGLIPIPEKFLPPKDFSIV